MFVYCITVCSCDMMRCRRPHERCYNGKCKCDECFKFNGITGECEPSKSLMSLPYLIHFSRTGFSTLISRTCPLTFLGLSVPFLFNCFKENSVNKQVHTLIRCIILQHLIWVSTVLCPFKRMTGLYGFSDGDFAP